jgi:hypothetical protein
MSSLASILSELFGRRKRQSSLPIEQLLQTLVAGTGFAPDDAGGNELAGFPPGATAFEPIFPTD